MRDMLKRLERLEGLSGDKDPILIIVRFITPPAEPGGRLESVSAHSMWVGGIHPSETIDREPGETSDDFEVRASAYLGRHAPDRNQRAAT